MLSSSSQATSAPGLSCARQEPCSSSMRSKLCMACPSSRGSPLSVGTDGLATVQMLLISDQEPSFLHLLGRAGKKARRACKFVGVITPLLLLLCGHHSRAGSPDSVDGRRPRACRSARL